MVFMQFQKYHRQHWIYKIGPAPKNIRHNFNNITMSQLPQKSAVTTSPRNAVKSALTSYYMQSLLPFQSTPPLTQITKSKQFYKPEQFIWNNPHRTSKRIYPYYHQANDYYARNVKPLVEQMIEQDRTKDQQERIRQLSRLRNQTRQRFHSRQQKRIIIQIQAGVRHKQSMNKTEQYQNNSALALGLGLQSNMSQEQTQTKIPKKSQSWKFSRIESAKQPGKKKIEKSQTQQSYHMGVQIFDNEKQKFMKMCTDQLIQKQNRIRSQFKARKEANSIVNSHLKIGQHHFGKF